MATKATATEIKWGEDNPIEAAPVLSEEDQHTLKLKMEAMDKVLAQAQKAKYKLELFFGEARSMHKPVPGILSFWESGNQLHGGGDSKVYFCPGKLVGKNQCEKIIPYALSGYGFLVCPSCKEVWKGPDVVGEILGRHTMRDWARLLLQYFHRLDHNCDIYLKHAPADIRTMAALEQARELRGDKLSVARKRALHIYPLKNIIKDTASGADLLGRFSAFLLS